MNSIIQRLIAIVTGFLSNLTTTDKSNLVAAINEVKASSGGGGTDTNFANADLTADEDRAHDFGGNSVELKGINEFKISGRLISNQVIPYDGRPFMYFERGAGPNGEDYFELARPTPETAETLTLNIYIDGNITPVIFNKDDDNEEYISYLAAPTSGVDVGPISYIGILKARSELAIEAEKTDYNYTFQDGETYVEGTEILALVDGKVKSVLIPKTPPDRFGINGQDSNVDDSRSVYFTNGASFSYQGPESYAVNGAHGSFSISGENGIFIFSKVGQGQGQGQGQFKAHLDGVRAFFISETNGSSYFEITDDGISFFKKSGSGSDFITLNLFHKNLPVFENEAAAAALATDQIYKTSTGELRIKL